MHYTPTCVAIIFPIHRWVFFSILVIHSHSQCKCIFAQELYRSGFTNYEIQSFTTHLAIHLPSFAFPSSMMAKCTPGQCTTSMPTFNSNLFYWASRCLLWFDSTLLCLMLVSLFHISPQFGFQLKSDKLYETSVLCGYCFPQFISDLLWTSIPVFSQIILLFFS